jgi:hypothetical protein
LVNDQEEDVMDVKQFAGKCRQKMAGESAQGGDATGTGEQCGPMAAMFGGGEVTGMLKYCEQMAAQFARHGETAEGPEQNEVQDPQVA